MSPLLVEMAVVWLAWAVDTGEPMSRAPWYVLELIAKHRQHSEERKHNIAKRRKK